jgi:hypothetical protein
MSVYLLMYVKIPNMSRVVAYTSNPSYSGGRDWKDSGSRPAHTKSSEIPSQPIAGHGGTCLSSQLRGKYK